MDDDRAHLTLGSAFALWRLGRWKKARETLYPLVCSDIPELPNAHATFREIVADSCRVYLEVSRDLLLFLPKDRRTLEARRWKLAFISSRLHMLLDDLPNGNAQDRMLAHIVIRHIDWLTGKRMTFDDVHTEFITCLHSRYPTAAWATVVHLLQISLPSGMRAWRVLHDRLKEAHREDYLKKNYESLLVAIFAIVVSRIGLCLPKVAYASIRVAYGLRTERTESQFSRQLAKWEMWRQEWNRTGVLQTEIR